MQEECNQMQTRILTISKRLDEISMHNITNTSSSSITLHNQENELKQKQPVSIALISILKLFNSIYYLTRNMTFKTLIFILILKIIIELKITACK